MAEIPTDRYVFELKIVVQSRDIDELNHVNNVVYLQWVQDVAEAHWKTMASETLRSGCMWVVLRHEINYHVPALSGDHLIATTWIEQPDGPRQGRYVSIRRAKDNKVLCTARTTWCLLDPRTARPKRIPVEITEALGLKNGGNAL